MEELLKTCLAKFEATVDIQHQQTARALCQRVFEFEPVEAPPFVAADGLDRVDTDWPTFPYNDTFVDPTKMLLDQLRAPFIHNQLKDFHPLNIRCNYGTVILPSLFGVGFQLTETSLPWSHHLRNRQEVEELINQGVPDLEAGLGKRCFETLHFYQEVLSHYPRLQQAIAVYHPDLQGPFDVAHLVWGPDIFYALYDCPDLVHALLSLVTDTYRAWMRRWKDLTEERNEFTTHWSYYIKGGIMLRDDTPVMLSPQHYETFVKPYDQALLDEFGGCIHFCGNGNAFTTSMCESENLFGIHCSQPELNDTKRLIEAAMSNQVVLIGLPEAYVPDDLKTGVIVLR